MDLLNYSTILMVAFLGSFGHCVGMCGGFVLAYTTSKVDHKWSKGHQSSAHLLYNLGRVVSYAFLGTVFGVLGAILSFTLTTQGVLYIVIGMLMVLMGLSLMGKLGFLQTIEVNIANTSIFKQLYRKALTSSSLLSFFLIGILNGFIPCGFVYFFATAAVATSSAIDGAMVMIIFGLATIPAMFSIGLISGLLERSRYRQTFVTIASLLVILYGTVTIFNGSMMIKKATTSIEKVE
jgi:sulfite exporter TauE/SafE